MLNNIEKELLEKTTDLHSVPMGAYAIRKNGVSEERKSTKNIQIETNAKNNGLVIKIANGTKNESVHIPVIVSQSGLVEVVENDFIIGDNCSVLIVAGCGIHSSGSVKTEHDGLHRFKIGKNSIVRYIEKHYASGTGKEKVLSPITEIELADNSKFDMETHQIGGVTNANRKTIASLSKNSKLNISEKLLTDGDSHCKTEFIANLNGEDSSVHIVSRAVAKDKSKQEFKSVLNGNNKCFGHTECDAIIVGNASVCSVPQVNAVSPDASLIHEAAIGKIAGDQILKLLTLGLSEEQAQNEIIKGFLN